MKDTQIYYEVHGRGEPIVFLSETACDGEIWKIHQLEESSRDHQVILHDDRGTGRSGRPSIDYSTKMFCDDTAALMDHLGPPKGDRDRTLDGRRIADLLALEDPDKVDKLILASTGAAFPATKGLPLKICQEMIEWGHGNMCGITRLRRLHREFAKASDRVERDLRVRMANPCPVGIYLRHLIARQSHDTTGCLKDIRVPTLILVGEDDRNVTSDINDRSSSEILAQGIPNAKLAVLPGERHSYFFANPDAAHKTIREFMRVTSVSWIRMSF